MQRKVVYLTNEVTVNQRFHLLVDTLGHSQVVLSQMFGLSQGYISQLISGKRKITAKILLNIAKKIPGINIGWVLTGDGEMFLANYYQLELPSGNQSDEVNDPSPGYESDDPVSRLSEVLRDMQQRIASLEKDMAELKRK